MATAWLHLCGWTAIHLLTGHFYSTNGLCLINSMIVFCRSFSGGTDHQPKHPRLAALKIFSAVTNSSLRHLVVSLLPSLRQVGQIETFCVSSQSLLYCFFGHLCTAMVPGHSHLRADAILWLWTKTSLNWGSHFRPIWLNQFLLGQSFKPVFCSNVFWNSNRCTCGKKAGYQDGHKHPTRSLMFGYSLCFSLRFHSQLCLFVFNKASGRIFLEMRRCINNLRKGCLWPW